MTKEKRITVEDVRAAYRKCGWKPARGVWISYESEGKLCCPQVAIFIADNPNAEFLTSYVQATSDRWGGFYACGFRDGWDGRKPTTDSLGYDWGYTDGRAAAEAMFGGDNG